MRSLNQFLVYLYGILLLAGCQSDSSTPIPDAIMVLEQGEVGFALYDDTPLHKENFLKLASEGFFDGMAFHRVIYEFMIQTGDPRTQTTYPATDTSAADGPGYTLPAEILPQHVHTRGKIGAARYDDEENPERRSSGSQFYIVTGRMPSITKLDSMEAYYSGVVRGEYLDAYYEATGSGAFRGDFQSFLQSQHVQDFRYPSSVRTAYLREGGAAWLDFTYTVFGEVLYGMEHVEAIARTPVDPYSRPKAAIRIQKMIVPKKN